MTRFRHLLFGLLLGAGALAAQSDAARLMDQAITSVGRPRSLMELAGAAFDHPIYVEARHPKAGCADTAECGQIFFQAWSHNLRTSVGTNWQSQLMNDTSTPSVNTQCTYIGLTNTAITPAVADTALSGEITANGLARQQATYANLSGTISVPSAPTVTVEGTAGSTSLWYWVSGCNQGICTTPSAAGTTTTSQATASLSSVLYNQISFTPVTGASSYVLQRTTSSAAPTGTQINQVPAYAFCNGVGTAATTCYMNDVGAALVSVTTPSSNLTNYGLNTLVYTWTATASQAAQAFGVFTAAGPPVAGTMCFEGTFTSVSLSINDTFKLTESIYF
jgi:hypothetical protein